MKKLFPILLLFSLLPAACGGTRAPTPAASPVVPTASPRAIQSVAVPEDTLLGWAGSPQCDRAAFTADRIFYQTCDGGTAVASLDAQAAARLAEIDRQYGPLRVMLPAGALMLAGKGRLVPAEAEQRALAEWARLQFESATTGQPADGLGMVLSWSREGGIHGVCDGLSVAIDGRVAVSSCKDDSLVSAGYMTASQLETLYGHLDRLAAFRYQHKDPAVADAISTSLMFTGSGSGQPSEEDRQAVIGFASALFVQYSQAAVENPERSAAETVLRRFFTALAAGDYAAVLPLYGGSYETLQTWNPETAPSDLAGLWQLGCTQNGLVCLQVRAIAWARQVSDTEYLFSVEFSTSNGKLFQQGPCCGETEGSILSVFDIQVVKGETGWQVWTLPPYVP